MERVEKDSTTQSTSEAEKKHEKTSNLEKQEKDGKAATV